MPCFETENASKNATKSAMKNASIRFTALVVLSALLSGCAMPVPMRIASLAADGISYITTQKSVMDNGLSAVSGQDCAMLRLATEGKACRDRAPGVGFDTNISSQDSAAFWGGSSICNMGRISKTLPNTSALYRCAERLVDAFGEDGAIAHADQRIMYLVSKRDTDSAGVWIGVQAAMRQSINAQ